jgi:hypothetical protein
MASIVSGKLCSCMHPPSKGRNVFFKQVSHYLPQRLGMSKRMLLLLAPCFRPAGLFVLLAWSGVIPCNVLLFAVRLCGKEWKQVTEQQKVSCKGLCRAAARLLLA